jgi:hypothetical protein
VTFYDGIDVLGSASVANGQAVLSTDLLPSGARNLSAVYGANSNYGRGGSPILVQTVNAVADTGIAPPSRYAVDTAPQYVAGGDFNRDGIPDLVTANTGASGTGTVSILVGYGDGTFQPAVNYPAGPGPIAVAVADFNRDGNADLAVTGANGIYILLGNGDGSFQAALTYSQSGLSGVTVADVNRDGIPDLVAVTAGVGVSVLFGNGDGTFGGAVVTAIAGFSYWSVADVNGDSIPDLVVDIGPDAAGPPVSTYLGNANGTFQPPLNSPTIPDYSPFAMAVGDFNGDGKPDVALFYGGSLQTLLGNGDGTFQMPIPSNIQLNDAPSTAFAGDFNGDGKVDIICGFSPAFSDFVLIPGNGDGTFRSGATYSTDGHPGNIALGDFNGDGNPDFVAPGGITGDDVDVFLGLESSTLYIQSVQSGPFVIGQAGGYYQLIVSNPHFSGSSTGTVTVIDTLPAGLTATGILAPGWSCVVATLTCTTSDTLLAGQSYGGISLYVSASNSLSPGTVINSASVSSLAGSYTTIDRTNIVAFSAPVLKAPANGATVTPPLTLSWNAAPGANLYQVLLGTSMPPAPLYMTGATSVVAPALTPGTIYYWQVVAQGSTGSASSAVWSFATEPVIVDSFFAGEQIISSAWNYLQFPDGNLFGYYAFLEGAAGTADSIFYHADLGYEYVTPGSAAGSVYDYDFASGHWWYTSSGLFPYLYDFTLTTWIYYFPNTQSPGHYTTDPRSFSNLTTGMIFTM